MMINKLLKVAIDTGLDPWVDYFVRDGFVFWSVTSGHTEPDKSYESLEDALREFNGRAHARLEEDFEALSQKLQMLNQTSED
jgi:hypothetical protein